MSLLCSLLPYLLLTELIKDLILWQGRKPKVSFQRELGSLVASPGVGNGTFPGWPPTSFSSPLRDLSEHPVYFCLSRLSAKCLEHFFWLRVRLSSARIWEWTYFPICSVGFLYLEHTFYFHIWMDVCGLEVAHPAHSQTSGGCDNACQLAGLKK